MSAIVSRPTPTRLFAATPASGASSTAARSSISDTSATVIMAAPPSSEETRACLVVERRSAKGSREQHVFVPGRVRLAVPVLARHGASSPKALAYLLYDGEHLEVSAALADVPVTVAGKRVGGAWRRVPVPSVLRVGDEELEVRGANPRAVPPKRCAGTVEGDRASSFDSEATVAAPVTGVPGKRSHVRTMQRPPTHARSAPTSRPATPIQVSREQLVQAASVPPPESTLAPTSPSSRRELEARSVRGDSKKPASKRRRVVLAIASGAVSAALTTLLLLGGDGAFKGAVPRTRTAMAKESPRASEPTPPAGSAVSAQAASSATPSPSVPAETATVDASTPSPPSPAASSATATAPMPSSSAPDAPVRQGPTTLERQAIDLFARGAFTEAAAVYRELARQHPERRVFADAAAIADRRAATARRDKDGASK